MEIEKPIPLSLSDSDLDEATRRELERHLRSTRALGETEPLDRKILDALPTAITKRVKDVIPTDFELVEIELKFLVEGKLFGTGIAGEVIAKLRKKSQLSHRVERSS